LGSTTSVGGGGHALRLDAVCMKLSKNS